MKTSLRKTNKTTKWVVSYSDTAIGYGEKVKTFTNELDARNCLEKLKEKNTDPSIEYFMYEKTKPFTGRFIFLFNGIKANICSFKCSPTSTITL